MFSPCDMQLPTVAAFAAAIERAIQVVCDACASAQRRVMGLFSDATSDSSTPSPSPLQSAVTVAVVPMFTFAPRRARGLAPATHLAPAPVVAPAPVAAPEPVVVAPAVMAMDVVEEVAISSAVAPAAAPIARVFVPRSQVFTRRNFVPDQDETQAELVVFGPPRIFQGGGEYDLRIFDAVRRMSCIDQPMRRRRLAWIANVESILVRSNAGLRGVLAEMSPNPVLAPEDPSDPATEFCSCGQCPHGIAATHECKFLTIFWRSQRFRRRAAVSPASTAINQWHRACSTRPAFGRVRC